MISQLLPFFKNVKAGPKTTGFGAILIIFGGYLAVTAEDTLMAVLDSGIILTGIICFFLKDWQKGLKEKEDEKN